VGIAELNTRIMEIIASTAEFDNLVRDVAGKMTASYNGIKYRIPGALEITSYDELYVIGDLHGDYSTLLEFIERENILDKLEASNIVVVFLGDYIDRGPQQLEVLATVLYLKNKYPGKIVVLRGNHEPSPMLIPIPHDFSDIVLLRYGEEGKNLLSDIYKLFQRLPYVARVPGLFLLLHGGPPRRVIDSESYEEAFSIGLPVVDDTVIEDILWSDPIDDENILIEPSMRGAGVVYGPQVTRKALELAGVKFIIRGHEPVEGFLLNHMGRVVTIFDARIPNYGISRASYVKVSGEESPNDIRKVIHLIT